MASEMYAPPVAWNALLDPILSLTSPISILCSSVKALDAALRVNTYGPIFVSQTFLPEVLRSRLKTVVLISSNASSFGLKMCVSPISYARPRADGACLLSLSFDSYVQKPGDLGAYSISKSAANNFFLRLGQEVEKDGARVIVYHPGTPGRPLLSPPFCSVADTELTFSQERSERTRVRRRAVFSAPLATLVLTASFFAVEGLPTHNLLSPSDAAQAW